MTVIELRQPTVFVTLYSHAIPAKHLNTPGRMVFQGA